MHYILVPIQIIYTIDKLADKFTKHCLIIRICSSICSLHQLETSLICLASYLQLEKAKQEFERFQLQTQKELEEAAKVSC